MTSQTPSPRPDRVLRLRGAEGRARGLCFWKLQDEERRFALRTEQLRGSAEVPGSGSGRARSERLGREDAYERVRSGLGRQETRKR